jgi:hypothetical protein
MKMIHASKSWLLALAMALGMAACAAEGVEPASDEPAAGEAALSEDALKIFQCTRDSQCVAPAAPCQLCSDGSAACPSASCVNHRCVASFPSCPPVDPCATVRCAAGTHCTAGQCIPDAKVVCGGIAGIACPGSGQCVDDPSDSCDPKRGGADCSGLCSCVDTVLCAIGYHFDANANVCACVPDAIGGGSCGGNTCGKGQYCCNASCGTCAPIGAACTQIACASPL